MVKRPGLSACAALAALAAGCSLLDLDEIETVPCKSDNEVCAPLNAGREHECMLYQCHPSGEGCVLAMGDLDGDRAFTAACRDRVPEGEPLDCDDQAEARAPGKRESFDGIDNDCDQIVDEGAPLDPPRPLFEPGLEPSRGEHAVRAGYAEHDGALWATYVAKDAQGERGVFGVERVTVEPAAGGGSDPQWASEPVVKEQRECTDSEALCQIAEVLLLDMGDELAWSAVSQSGCAEGKLWLGTLGADRFEPADSRCGLTEGIYDADVANRTCTGASRGDAGQLGAVALAGAGQSVVGEGQALLAWLGGDAERSECGGSEVNVEATGVWLPREHPEQIDVSPARPHVLGRTRAGVAPAVAVWEREGRGYFVAHADVAGALALHFVDTLPRAGDECGTSAPRFDMEPFSIDADGADHVALALRPADRVCANAEIALGIAWREACGQADARVRFVEAGYERATNEKPASLCIVGEPITLAMGEGAGGSMKPEIALVSEGLVTENFQRAGRSAGEEGGRGGFVVAWLQREGKATRLHAQRISALDAERVGEPQAIDLSDSAARFLRLTTQGGILGAVYWSDHDARFFVVPLVDPAASPAR